MSTAEVQQQLEAVLERQLHCSSELLQCLAAERKALTGRDTTALEQITLDKTRHTQALDGLEETREQLLGRLGFGSGAGGMESWLEKLGPASRPASLWNRVITNIRECRDSNIANGGILELGRQHVEQALAILRGGTGGGPAVYDAQGEAASSLGQRELGKV